eukprot:g1598.t1
MAAIVGEQGSKEMSIDEIWNDMKRDVPKREPVAAVTLAQLMSSADAGEKKNKKNKNNNKKNKKNKKKKDEKKSVVGKKKKKKKSKDSSAEAKATTKAESSLIVVSHSDVDRSSFSEEDLLRDLQRDINKLSHESQRTRLQALRRLYETLFGEAARAKKHVPGEDALRLFYPHTMKALLRRFSDPVEKCRELAINITMKFLECITDVGEMLPYAFPVIVERASQDFAFDPETEQFTRNTKLFEERKRGKAIRSEQQTGCVYTHSVVESSEELRLSMCELLHLLVQKVLDSTAPTQLSPYFTDCIFFALITAVDPFPLAKLEGMALLRLLAERVPPGMKMFAVGLIRMLVPGLYHRHTKVRLAALETVSALVTCPDEAKRKGAGTAAIVDLLGHRDANVIPIAAFYYGEARVNAFAKLVVDGSIAVRMKFTEMLGEWMHDLPDRYDHHGRLVPYMLSMVSDECNEVATVAMQWMERMGKQWEQEHDDDVRNRVQYGVDGSRHAQRLDVEYPLPFKGRPRLGTRLFVRSYARRFIKPLLAELGDWRDRTRVHAARLLLVVLVYLEEHITVHLHELVGTLCRSMSGMESSEWARKCTKLVARFVPPDTLIKLIIPLVVEDPAARKGGISRARALLVLASCISVMSRTRLEPLAVDILGALRSPDGINIRDVKERLGYFEVVEQLGRKFKEHSEFMGAKGRLVSLGKHIQPLKKDVAAMAVIADRDAGHIEGSSDLQAYAERAGEALEGIQASFSGQVHAAEASDEDLFDVE